MKRRPLAKLLTFLVTLAAVVGSAGTAEAFPPGQGPGGPILVISDPADPFDRYYAEILTAEGLNAFDVRDVGQVTDATLSGYSVVMLGPSNVSPAFGSSLSAWVQNGGNLIAMRPGPSLAGLLGLGSDTGDLDNRYIRVNTSSGPGSGITANTMQFHDRADRWTAPGATSIADLYTSATGATTNPAVTLRSVGTAGGQAAAFTYDLARSVVLTRQGNPAWAGLKRDGEIQPIRSDDLFFPSWVDLEKVAIPQADEQQRLLANLITHMTAERLPMPRFWYFPRGERAVVVMTGDDHTTDGTEAHFNRFLERSPAGCSIDDWECVRSTSYVYTANDMTDLQVATYQAQGFEIALHLNTGCANYDEESLRADWQAQRVAFLARWPSVAPPRTNRTHCIPWSDWSSQPLVEDEVGIGLDTNYYYWPPSWNQNRPGMFTGSGLPMRFADRVGSAIDVYQATTQLVDEEGIGIPAPANDLSLHIRTLLDHAIGPQGYFGAFTANMHTDRDLSGANAIVAAAQLRGVPVISAEQLLDWVEGRNNTSFAGLSFDSSRLRFSLNPAAGARGLEAMVPATWAAGRVSGLTRNGAPVATSSRVLKGIEYLVFAAAPGDYIATYPPASPPPPIVETPPPSGGPQDKLAPRVRVRPRRVRVSRSGLIKLRVSCPKSERFCRVDLRLRRADTTVARKKFRVTGGKTRQVSLRLKRGARRALSSSSSMRVRAVAAARDAAGNQGATRTRIRLLAPRRR